MTIKTKERGELGEVCVESGGIYVVTAKNRQALLDYIDSMYFMGQDGADYLHIKFSGEGCSGGSLICKTPTDIPSTSIPCPCGNPKHWLLKYEEEG